MNNMNISLKYLRTAVFKTILILALFAAVFIYASVCVHAEGEGGIVLTVQMDGKILKEFSLEDLQQIAVEEENITYRFTAWNTYPTFKVYKEVQGPTIAGILAKSGIKAEDIGETGTVAFTDKAEGGYTATLTGKQLFEDRYYYPNGKRMDPMNGVLDDAAYTDRVKTPAIVSITEVYDAYGEQVEKGKYKLYVGQVAPNEENNSLFVDNLAAGGYIRVSTEPAPQCKPVTADPENLTVWRAGKEVTLTSKNNYEYDKIYYTFDEDAVPDYGSIIYNCAPKQDIELKPVLPSGTGRAVLKVVVKGYGKQDSTVQKFTYMIGEPLTVKVDGEIIKTYDRDELDEFAAVDAGSAGLDYSGYNSYPTLQFTHTDSGYRVDSIIKDATGKSVSEFDSRNTVKFSGSDGYSSVFTFGQLFGSKRYYYPNAGKGTDNNGGKALTAAYNDKKQVPAVIESSRESRLLFGQIAPNEQNHSEFVNYMLQGGTIEISNSQAEKCASVSGSSPSNGSVVQKGTSIIFPIPENNKNKRDKLYYIVDPSEGQIPGSGCAFYYYAPYHWPEEKTNPPAFSTAGHHTIATRITAYGKQDSDIKVFDFYVKPDAPTDLKGTAASYNSAKLTWSAQKGVSGYRIYRAKSGESLAKYKDVGSGQTSFTDKGLATGTTYRYAVAALADGGTKTLVSAGSGSVQVKPVLGKTKVTLTAGSKKIKVKWTKVSGASGYEIMRSTKKSSGYKRIKTIKKGSVVSFTNKKLKKGKKYYYKVRAYRTVNGKRVYGAYSAVKAKRAN